LLIVHFIFYILDLLTASDFVVFAAWPPDVRKVKDISAHPAAKVRRDYASTKFAAVSRF